MNREDLVDLLLLLEYFKDGLDDIEEATGESQPMQKEIEASMKKIKSSILRKKYTRGLEINLYGQDVVIDDVSESNGIILIDLVHPIVVPGLEYTRDCFDVDEVELNVK